MKMCIKICFHLSHALASGGPGKDSSSALANPSTLVCSRSLLLSMRGLPSSFLLSTYLVRGFTLLHTKEESGRIAISTLKTAPDLDA